MKNKKGQVTLANFTFLAVSFAVVILLLTFLTDMQNDVRDQQVDDTTFTVVTNESVTWTNTSFVSLTRQQGESFSCTGVFNNQTGFFNGAQANESINSGNWTCSNFQINVTDLTSPELNITNTVLVTYQFKPLTAVVNVSDNGLDGEVNLSGQFGNLGTVVALVLIVTLLVSAFGFMFREDG